MNKVLNDTRGIVISAGDVISIATNKFGEQGALHDINVVDYIGLRYLVLRGSLSKLLKSFRASLPPLHSSINFG